ncbi:MAG: dethiobiotin synthetase [Glaciecola sp.]|jgi:dethiobiotin synthetase
MKTVFITGTDTDAGKTYVSVLLLKAINQKCFKTIAFKPIAAGCEQTVQGLQNDDALQLQTAANVSIPYNLANPIALEPAIAPHIAAAQLGKPIDMLLVSKTLADLQCLTADLLLIEGAGGWRLPVALPALDKSARIKFLSEFVMEHKMSVVLVVGMKLGCLNHAALTFEQIKRDGCQLVGWVANQIDPNMLNYAENLKSLAALIDAPMLAEVTHGQKTLNANDEVLGRLISS